MIYNNLKKIAIAPTIFLLCSFLAAATPANVASMAKVSSSGSLSGAFDAANVTDGIIGWENTGE